MHEHRSAGWPQAIARPGTRKYDDQRRLLLELVVDPPADGEPVGLLAAQLDRSRAAITVAARALERAGLAEQGPAGWRASPVARAFEALWPTGL
jgi:hypothetical protein